MARLLAILTLWLLGTAPGPGRADQIILPAGTYTLALSGTDDFAAVGDLDIRGNLTITGKNAGVAVPITGTASPMEGSATLTDAQAADLTGGKWYVNVHTATNKGGEIRGQVAKK